MFVRSDSESRQPYKRVEGDDLFPSEELFKKAPQLEKDMSYMKVV